MNDYNYYKKIWCEMVSGIVFKSRLNEYRKLYEYITTNKDYLHGVSTGKYEELLIDEIDYIITSISLGKKFTKDYWGVELKIIDDTDLQQDYYLVRKVNKLFETFQALYIFPQQIPEEMKSPETASNLF